MESFKLKLVTNGSFGLLITFRLNVVSAVAATLIAEN